MITHGTPNVQINFLMKESAIVDAKTLGKETARKKFDSWSCIVSMYSLPFLVLGSGPTMFIAILSKTVPKGICYNHWLFGLESD